MGLRKCHASVFGIPDLMQALHAGVGRQLVFTECIMLAPHYSCTPLYWAHFSMYLAQTQLD